MYNNTQGVRSENIVALHKMFGNLQSSSSNSNSNSSSTGFSLFGNSSSTNNNNNNNNITNNNNASTLGTNTNQSAGFLLFGNKPSIGNLGAVTNSFGSSFGSNAVAPLNNINNNSGGFSGKSATLDDSPFGISLSLEKVKEMPKSITEKDEAPLSTADESSTSFSFSPRSSKSKLKKKQSSSVLGAASPSTNKKPSLYQSNILNGIRNSKANRRVSSVSFNNKTSDILDTPFHGLFSPAKDNIKLNLTPEKETQFSSTLSQQYSKDTFDFTAYNNAFQFNSLFGKENIVTNNSSTTNLLAGYSNMKKTKCQPNDIKRLVIDPEVSAAKRRKLLDGAKSIVPNHNDSTQSATTEERTGLFGKKRFFSFGATPEKAKYVSEKHVNRPVVNIKRFTKPQEDAEINAKEREANEIRELEQKVEQNRTPNGYWCSPSVSKLAQLSLSELSSVTNFIIGRKDHGQIAFTGTVDLVDFAKANSKYSTKLNLYNSLLKEEFIMFHDLVVEVYPDGNTKPPQGRGINVEAIITLENIYPKRVRASTAQGDDEFSMDEINKFIYKLKKKKGMEFVNYIASNGSWSFKVQHFSIWGLVDSDEEDGEEDADDDTSGKEKKVGTKGFQEQNAEYKQPKTHTQINLLSQKQEDLPIKSSIKIPAKRTQKIVEKLAGKQKGTTKQSSSFKQQQHNVEQDKFAFKKLKTNEAVFPGSWSFSEANNTEPEVVAEQENAAEKANNDQAKEEVDAAPILIESETDSNVSRESPSMTKSPEEELVVELSAEPIDVDNNSGNNSTNNNKALVKVPSRESGVDEQELEQMKSMLLDSEMYEDYDGLVNEKPYEPLDVDEDDLKILDVQPAKILEAVTNTRSDATWSDTFDEINGGISVFDTKIQKLVAKKVPKYPFAITDKDESAGDSLDDLLFGDLNNLINQNEKAYKSLRLGGNKIFGKWDHVSNQIFTNATLQGFKKPKNTAVQFHSINEHYGINNKNSLIIDDVFLKHFNLSNIGKRESTDFPKVLPNENLKFDFLLKPFKASFDGKARAEGNFWDLASILFDESKILQHNSYKEINKLSEDKRRNHLINLSRIELLQSWFKSQIQLDIQKLKAAIYSTANNDNDADEKALEEVFVLLCDQEIQKAILLAQKSKNFHIAVLISLLGSNDANVRFSAKKQLGYWLSNSSANFIPKPILKIYKLLTGDFLLSGNDGIDVTEGLDWKIVYSLLISYGDANKNVSDLTKEFFSKYVEKQNIEMSLELGILKIFSLLDTVDYDTIESTLLKLQNAHSSILDVRIQWYIYEILIRSKGLLSSASLLKGDKLTILFAEQLIGSGKWEEALFVYLHLNEDELAERLISNLIFENIDKVITLKGTNEETSNESKKLNYLITTYQIPKRLLASAIALKYHYLGDYLNEAYALLEAENWIEAHNIILNKVAPNSVIGGGKLLDKLLNLINRFPKEVEKQFTIVDWSKGLGVYKNYILLLFNGNDATLTESLVVNLAVHLPLVEQRNFEIKAAMNIISKFVVKKNFDLSQRKVEVSKLLNLPLSQSEKNYIAESHSGCGASQAA